MVSSGSICGLLMLLAQGASHQVPLSDTHYGAIIDRLNDVVPVIKKILDIGGSAGTSIGVSLDGKAIFKETFGYQDVESGIETGSTTVYVLGSLTKAFVSTVTAHYVDEGLLKWTTPITEYLPEFSSRFDASLSEQFTLIDLLSHRTDLIRKDLLWLGANNEVLVRKEDLLSVCNDLRPVCSIRSKWLYNNWMYALAGEILERKTGKSFKELLKQVVTDPLNLRDTRTDLSGFSASQLAKPYLVGDDHKLYAIEDIDITSGSLMETAGGIRSNIDDMLAWTTAIIETVSSKNQNGSIHELNTELRLVGDVLSGQIVLSKSHAFDELYAMGWAKVTIPTRFGMIGFNPSLVREMPTLGLASEPELVFYHNGALPGFNNAIFMIPRKNLSIIVLTNSIGQGDVADWVGQLLLQTTLDTQPRIDFVKHAKDAAEKWRMKYSEMESALISQRINSTTESNREDFIGTYWHTSGAIKVDITKTNSDTLRLTVNDSPSQVHDLVHYNYETYSFFPSREDRIRRALIMYHTKAWLVHFLRDKKEGVQIIRWLLDPDEPDGELFMKRS